MSMMKMLNCPYSKPRVQANATHLPSGHQEGLATSPVAVGQHIRAASVDTHLPELRMAGAAGDEHNSVPFLGLTLGSSSIGVDVRDLGQFPALKIRHVDLLVLVRCRSWWRTGCACRPGVNSGVGDDGGFGIVESQLAVGFDGMDHDIGIVVHQMAVHHSSAGSW